MSKVTIFQYMYLQVNGGICGGRIMANYKENGGRNLIQAFIIKIVNKDWWHSWQQAFLEHFTLGGFGSPEKDQGFVFCGGGDVLSPHFRVLDLSLPFPVLGISACVLVSVLTWISFFHGVAGLSFISFLTVCWYCDPPGLLVPVMTLWSLVSSDTIFKHQTDLASTFRMFFT